MSTAPAPTAVERSPAPSSASPPPPRLSGTLWSNLKEGFRSLACQLGHSPRRHPSYIAQPKRQGSSRRSKAEEAGRPDHSQTSRHPGSRCHVHMLWAHPWRIHMHMHMHTWRIHVHMHMHPPRAPSCASGQPASPRGRLSRPSPRGARGLPAVHWPATCKVQRDSAWGWRRHCGCA